MGQMNVPHDVIPVEQKYLPEVVDRLLRHALLEVRVPAYACEGGGVLHPGGVVFLDQLVGHALFEHDEGLDHQGLLGRCFVDGAVEPLQDLVVIVEAAVRLAEHKVHRCVEPVGSARDRQYLFALRERFLVPFALEVQFGEPEPRGHEVGRKFDDPPELGGRKCDRCVLAPLPVVRESEVEMVGRIVIHHIAYGEQLRRGARKLSLGEVHEAAEIVCHRAAWLRGARPHNVLRLVQHAGAEVVHNEFVPDHCGGGVLAQNLFEHSYGLLVEPPCFGSLAGVILCDALSHEPARTFAKDSGLDNGRLDAVDSLEFEGLVGRAFRLVVVALVIEDRGQKHQGIGVGCARSPGGLSGGDGKVVGRELELTLGLVEGLSQARARHAARVARVPAVQALLGGVEPAETDLDRGRGRQRILSSIFEYLDAFASRALKEGVIHPPDDGVRPDAVGRFLCDHLGGHKRLVVFLLSDEHFSEAQPRRGEAGLQCQDPLEVRPRGLVPHQLEIALPARDQGVDVLGLAVNHLGQRLDCGVEPPLIHLGARAFKRARRAAASRERRRAHEGRRLRQDRPRTGFQPAFPHSCPTCLIPASRRVHRSRSFL